MAKPDFTRKPTAVPPAAGVSPLPQTNDGNAPLKKGRLFVGGNAPPPGVFVSDWTASQLRAVGWTENDPIPPNLAEQLQKIQRELAEDKAGHALPPDFKPSLAETITIDKMPKDYQDEIGKFIRAYGEQVRADEAEDARIAEHGGEDVDPSVAAALAAAAASAQASGPPMPDVVYAQPQPAAASPLPIPAGKTLAGAAGIHPMFAGGPLPGGQIPTPPPAAEPPPPPPAAAPAKPASAGGAEPNHKCPRCHFDQRLIFDVEPSQQDRETYVAAILGQQRFRKTLELFGGKVKVTFRGMTSAETDLLFIQLGYDTRAGRLLGDGEYWMQLSEYRMTMQVERVEYDRTTNEMPDVLTIPFDPPPMGKAPETVLVQASKWFRDNVIPQETLRRVIGQQHRQFQRLVETLEAQSLEPDFWQGIAP